MHTHYIHTHTLPSSLEATRTRSYLNVWGEIAEYVSTRSTESFLPRAVAFFAFLEVGVMSGLSRGLYGSMTRSKR